MTSDGSNTYAWDARNQLSQFNAVSFQYDAAGRRTKNAVGNIQLYDGADSVQELSGTTVLSNRITGGVDEFFSRSVVGGQEAGSYAPVTDALGSTIAMVNSSGSILTSYVYDPFGNTTVSGSSTNQFQYTGREDDANGLYFYRARYYSPLLGRFISEDPLEFDSGDVNFYAYAGDDPIDLDDPSGMVAPGTGTHGKSPGPSPAQAAAMSAAMSMAGRKVVKSLESSLCNISTAYLVTSICPRDPIADKEAQPAGWCRTSYRLFVQAEEHALFFHH
jgi:RHS repeat-associated protein